jgi:hypothetical protein
MGVVARADYGTHFNPTTGKGSHATDTPNDMDVQHFCGAREAILLDEVLHAFVEQNPEQRARKHYLLKLFSYYIRKHFFFHNNFILRKQF